MKKGIITIFGICIVSVVLWLLSKFSPDGITGTTLKSLAQVAGVIAATLLAIEFILASRLKILDTYLGGLDTVYKLHHSVGGLAFIIAMWHPTFLVMDALPDRIKLALSFVLPTGQLSYNLGVFTLYALIALIILTYYVKLPYHIWRFTHSLMAIPLVLGTIHVFLITSDTTRFAPLRIWLLTLFLIAIYAYVYRRFLYHFIGPVYEYYIEKVVDYGDVTDIFMQPKSKAMNVTAGQFIYVSFLDGIASKERHPFTISSVPKDGFIRVTVKKSGDYTKQLSGLQAGQRAKLYGPYGTFGEKSIVRSQKHQIWIAGGIGITPFLSLARYHALQRSSGVIDLFYCTNTKEEAHFLPELLELSKMNPALKIHPFYTSEKGRLNADNIVEVVPEYISCTVFICGPLPMMKSLREQLATKGVKNRNIITEEFGFK
jgi:predicted ferric reductase